MILTTKLLKMASGSGLTFARAYSIYHLKTTSIAWKEQQVPLPQSSRSRWESLINNHVLERVAMALKTSVSTLKIELVLQKPICNTWAEIT